MIGHIDSNRSNILETSIIHRFHHFIFVFPFFLITHFIQ